MGHMTCWGGVKEYFDQVWSRSVIVCRRYGDFGKKSIFDPCDPMWPRVTPKSTIFIWGHKLLHMPKSQVRTAKPWWVENFFVKSRFWPLWPVCDLCGVKGHMTCSSRDKCCCDQVWSKSIKNCWSYKRLKMTEERKKERKKERRNTKKTRHCACGGSVIKKKYQMIISYISATLNHGTAIFKQSIYYTPSVNKHCNICGSGEVCRTLTATPDEFVAFRLFPWEKRTLCMCTYILITVY